MLRIEVGRLEQLDAAFVRTSVSVILGKTVVAQMEAVNVDGNCLIGRPCLVELKPSSALKFQFSFERAGAEEEASSARVLLPSSILHGITKLSSVAKKMGFQLEGRRAYFSFKVTYVGYQPALTLGTDHSGAHSVPLDARYRNVLSFLSEIQRAVTSSSGDAPSPLTPNLEHDDFSAHSALHVNSSSIVEKEPVSLTEFRWTGEEAVTVHSIFVSVDGPVIPGTVVCQVEVSTTSGSSYVGYDQAANYQSPYGGGQAAGAGYSDFPPGVVGFDSKYCAAKDEDDTNDEAEATEMIRILWTDTTPGVIHRLHVRTGSLLLPGGLIASVNTAANPVTYLLAADRLSFANQASGKSTAANETFQRLAESVANNVATGFSVCDTSSLNTLTELERAIHNFTTTARTYGRVIISELDLPYGSKTVRPLVIGGVLGGSKYIVRGVLFKVPTGEGFESYPDPIAIANKIQGHELKGANAYFRAYFNRGTLGVVSFPLMAIIDYKGHRLTAMARLPVDGSNTLIYGSDNAGGECTVHNDQPCWSQFVKEVSETDLGLKSHFVRSGR